MTLPEETGHVDTECMDCGNRLPVKVLKSGAGYYIGTFCPKCGPYSRESGYYPNLVAAQEALRKGIYYRI